MCWCFCLPCQPGECKQHMCTYLKLQVKVARSQLRAQNKALPSLQDCKPQWYGGQGCWVPVHCGRASAATSLCGLMKLLPEESLQIVTRLAPLLHKARGGNDRTETQLGLPISTHYDPTDSGSCTEGRLGNSLCECVVGTPP